MLDRLYWIDRHGNTGITDREGRAIDREGNDLALKLARSVYSEEGRRLAQESDVPNRMAKILGIDDD